MDTMSVLSSFFNYLMKILFVILLCAVCWGRLILTFIKNKYSPVKTVKAVVVDKYKAHSVSRIQGTFKRDAYIVVFLAGNKRLSFRVSEFSFQNYRIKERGILKYKGYRIIDFS